MSGNSEMRLTKQQEELLTKLAAGEHIVYSQDGDVGWLWPSRLRLEKLGISDRELQQLRDRKMMGAEQGDDEDHGRFGPSDVITEAGRAALSLSKGDQT